MGKLKDLVASLWYMQQVVEHGYARDTLLSLVINRVYEWHGKAMNNFGLHLPHALVKQALNPYLFDLLQLKNPPRVGCGLVMVRRV